ncbi:MAG: cytidylate kinase-like family protein [Syntrophomonadaceae bacterium]|nr:cytidylate kinase-like family protein [Syntrophomonadaceae bacterium]
MNNYVITIARGFGSGGKEIAGKLSKKLGISCYERQILQMASEQSGIAEGIFAETDEKLKGHKLAIMLKALPFNSVVEPTSRKFTSDVNLFNIQANIIRSLAESESCIIIGKCANFLLQNYNNVISIYIEAPRAACVKSVMSKMGVAEEQAHKMITKTDKYRYDYYKFYTGGKDWRDPVAYDMTLNSDRIGRNQCVEIICDYLKIKFDGGE